MANQDGIMSLPPEIFTKILKDTDITCKDVVNLALTCKHLKQTIFTDNLLWKAKLFQRWPFLKNPYFKNESQKRVTDWFSQVQSLFKNQNYLRHQLSTMSERYYVLKNMSRMEMKEFDSIFRSEREANPMAYYLLYKELTDLTNAKDTYQRLTVKYYARHVLNYMEDIHLTEEWHNFLQLPPEKQLLERAATMTSQWFQTRKHISYHKINVIIDWISEQAKETLKDQNRTHPFFKVSEENIEYWRNNNINDNHWGKEETKEIIDAVCVTLFHKLRFRASEEVYYHDIFIDRVLEHREGRKITLSIIVCIICRRFGVKCEFVKSDDFVSLLHCKEVLLRCRITCSMKDKVKNVCIRGQYDDFSLSEDSSKQAGSLTEVMVNAVEQLISSCPFIGIEECMRAWEYIYLLRPYSLKLLTNLVRFNQEFDLNSFHLLDSLNYIKKNRISADPFYGSPTRLVSVAEQLIIRILIHEESRYRRSKAPIERKERTEELKYAVGMLMVNKRCRYLCVIIGWDIKYNLKNHDQSDIFQHELENVTNLDQPFYKVFRNYRTSYVAQEKLARLKISNNIRKIKHEYIGKYFNEFQGRYYEPNAELNKEYPDDKKIREQSIKYWRR